MSASLAVFLASEQIEFWRDIGVSPIKARLALGSPRIAPNWSGVRAYLIWWSLTAGAKSDAVVQAL